MAAGDDWRFCPRCGAAVAHVARTGPPRPTCTSCGAVWFLNPGVGAATVVRDAAGRLLMVQRSPGQFGAGKWCFPCGFVEWGEDVRAAAARETREEAGVEVEVGEVLWVTTNFHDPAKPTIGIWFAAAIVAGSPEPQAGDDAAAVGWFDPGAPPALAFPTDRDLLARLGAGGDREGGASAERASGVPRPAKPARQT
jgi:8-oxo-dGTP diphosphatase